MKIKNWLGSRYYFTLTSSWFNFIFAAAVFILYNGTFLEKFKNLYGFPAAVLASLSLILVLNIVFSLFFFRGSSKAMAVILIVCNAFVVYFMKFYKVAIDKIMVLNLLQTDFYEVQDLLSLRMLTFSLFYIILPLFLLYKTQIVYGALRREITRRAAVIAGSALIVAAVFASTWSATQQILRRNKAVIYWLTPVNYLGAVASAAKIVAKNSAHKFVKIAEDAQIVPYWQQNGKKNLFVFMVGETARAANFSLNGYGRDTSKELKKYGHELLNYANAYSCGTSTAVSVPCMFSKDGRSKFVPGSEVYTENLLDIFEKVNYRVLWRENNTSCQNNCKRVEAEDVCHDKTCFDDALLKGFEDRLSFYDNEDVFVVMHQKGSHGPNYFERYPKEFEIYKPVCTSEILPNCDKQALLNAYDNSIVYTNHILAQTIEKLKSLSDRYNTVLLYASDHGESLGEDGLYLHAAPYNEAPDIQTNIPFMIWFSDDFASAFRLDRGCLKAKLKETYSHDNIFHTFLGLAGIKTSEYNPQLDMLAACRKI